VAICCIFILQQTQAYVRYYNKKYNRHGHLFQDRFKSTILSTDEYNLTVSAYIHNNPHDIAQYSGKEEFYKYSSYGIYIGIRRDILDLVDKSFVMGIFNISDEAFFAKKYYEFVRHQRDIGSYAKLKKKLSAAAGNEYISGRKVIIREHTPSKVVSYTAGKMMVDERSAILTKSKRKLLDYRAFTAYVLRVLCGLGYKEICKNICNMTISGCSRLCSRGYELMERDVFYRNLFDELVSCHI